MSEKNNKRNKKFFLSKEEKSILRWLFVRTLAPIIITILITSIILFFGLQFLIEKTSFANYGLSPGAVTRNFSQFITTYTVIALLNVMLIIFLCFFILRLILYSILLPILRITNEIRNAFETNERKQIVLRKTDVLFISLIEQINKLISKSLN